jgi:hypothetical protein
MSRRGRSTGAAISLFSFQDIITSVTAIMILLVLILTLELVSRSSQRGVAVEDRRVAREFRESVRSMEQHVQSLREELVGLQTRANASASFSATDTRQRARDATVRADRLAEEIAILEASLRTATSERRQSEADLLAAGPTSADESPDHIEALERRVAEIETTNSAERQRQRDSAESGAADGSPPTLIFNVPPGDSLEPRLLEVSADGLVALAADAGEHRRFRGPGREFDRWLASLDSAREYVVIVLRPTGVKVYQDVVDAIEAAGISVGAELVGESMTVAVRQGE